MQTGRQRYCPLRIRVPEAASTVNAPETQENETGNAGREAGTHDRPDFRTNAGFRLPQKKFLHQFEKFGLSDRFCH